MGHSRPLTEALETGLVKLAELDAVAAVRGEGTVWGIQCAGVGGRSAGEIARQFVRDSYRGDAQGRAVHLLGPLAGDVIRIAPPLVMPAAEARTYLDAMYEIARQLGGE